MITNPLITKALSLQHNIAHQSLLVDVCWPTCIIILYSFSNGHRNDFGPDRPLDANDSIRARWCWADLHGRTLLLSYSSCVSSLQELQRSSIFIALSHWPNFCFEISRFHGNTQPKITSVSSDTASTFILRHFKCPCKKKKNSEDEEARPLSPFHRIKRIIFILNKT